MNAHRRFRVPAGLAIAVSIAWLAGTSIALAQAPHDHAHHEHPPERGTREAPLDIVRAPTDVPPPIGDRGPQIVAVELETVEVYGRLADGAVYHYWTFNEKVPGPFIRVRVGDTVVVTLRNPADSAMEHNVDFHAATGPGGGAAATLAPPGEVRNLTFKALKPGLFVYHCAVPMAAQHIANGMYGLILVEPEEGLPPVDREFYVMQGEIYTEEAFGTEGLLTESLAKLLDERPEYYVFNGAAEALTGANALRATTGESVRLFFGVGGPAKVSSFHVIGEHFDTVYDLASLASQPLRDVQTILVPPGGAAIVDLRLEVPGEYVLVDHALQRVNRGLIGTLLVEGAERPDLLRAASIASTLFESASADGNSDAIGTILVGQRDDGLVFEIESVGLPTGTHAFRILGIPDCTLDAPRTLEIYLPNVAVREAGMPDPVSVPFLQSLDMVRGRSILIAESETGAPIACAAFSGG
jgi:nitrite reductase (NO-forming)